MAMYQIECAYTCHTGNIRANNEDNFWCFGESLPVNNEGTKGICSKIISGNRAPAMAVFDGMGGESCGEIAAFLASEEFGKFYNTNKRMLRDMPEEFIDGVCKRMNQAVCRYGTEHHIWSMGSTMAMLLFTPESMFACNLGDSRIYFMDCGKLQQISTDHVLGSTAVGKYNENGSFYKKQKALLDVVEYHIHEDKEGFINALKKTKTDFVIVKTDGGIQISSVLRWSNRYAFGQ